ncbi:putative histone-lysine N-methyltransferase transcription factor C2H2 family [Medicago truncatula]|uniref:Histone-lysine N-methyltransferase SUVR5-like protein n=1 Tax=Medicago truncatula TaxID=3880 RepID=A0A072TTG4_MEDTR|nr:histone-lysine N-methyltransferase SUVR5 [Medicago truncatula]XP_024629401.1 histone-lysine N-methyltransferase SUVR5 [Medicago truncatula]XP_024629402.1 histone-lysine N-methyltransferase SUVR5 [Medicago truncatula]XP_024629403.1 histone-lysine N-methyltransferase SUVR5 [Medicago truncatula]XP_039684865.1 histone-lysine N-methyltransferase SUVR5 [Medicago truncatula]XP_039684866.1 histone-lysine N-methyltransferase SUVR5 [Medicago truncatula]KEH20451.1 histone-lysine N-methyltransferase S
MEILYTGCSETNQGAAYGPNEEHICVENCEYDISNLDGELSDSSFVMEGLHMDSFSLLAATKGQQCQAYIKDKGRQCVRTTIGNNRYCCVHFLSKKERRVKSITPICGGTTAADTRCKNHSLPRLSFCKKHLHKAEMGQTSNSISRTLKRKAEVHCSGSQSLICKDLVFVHLESPLEINPESVINDDDDDSFFAKNIFGETLKLSGNDQWTGSPSYGNDHNEDFCIDNENAVKCKVCFEEFSDNQTLGNHWMESHEKEAQWLFRGYACAFCFDSFANKKLLESHVQKRHYAQFGEHCLLFLCIPCGCHFGNMEELWLHVKSVHPVEFELLSKTPEQLMLSTGDDSPKMMEQGNEASLGNDNSENRSGSRKFSCRFCDLKFDLLPDLGRHHQAAHMERNLANRRLANSGVRYYAHRLKSGRLTRPNPKFERGLEEASNRTRRRAEANFKKRNQANKLLEMGEISIQPPHADELEKSQCSEAANTLFRCSEK